MTTVKIKASLAPMAGYSDGAFRKICSEMGAAECTSEMISAKALCMNSEKTRELALISEDEAPCILQLFGHEPKIVADAAEILLRNTSSPKPAGIEINMGCPVKKIFASGDGCALMQNPSLVREITSATAEKCAKYNTPLSVKIRLGVDENSINAPEIASCATENGAVKVTLHTRTRAQMYSPSARPELCRDVSQAVKSANPRATLCGNGDITDLASAEKYLECGCDEVSVGRAALGNPWIFRELSSPDTFTPPSDEEIIALAIRFVEDMAREKGEEVGVREARGRAAHFIKGMRGSAAARDRLNHAEGVGEFIAILRTLC